ncbi:MAG: hypothetical protein KGI00_01435 [Candidatus Micrarchaeota archaeon]|nr:hypothetical protein [Candidatus Micrarchaeota archaeon]MDE1824231.1 hypothetical protein [Candidatus Micrarchaeota archaeon]MDE1849372.1 hypothetical protein [Candidatus Micrarchaeota archaeon]
MPYIEFSDSRKRSELDVRQSLYGMPGPKVATLTIRSHSKAGTAFEDNADYRRTIRMLRRDPITGRCRNENEARAVLNKMAERAYATADAVLTAVRRSSEMAR